MSSEEDHYTPIACATYSEYEVAILHHQQLRVHWQTPDGAQHLASLRPLDLETCAGEEFLIAESGDGERLRIRLDWIRASAALR